MAQETEKYSRVLDLSRLGEMSPEMRAAFWIQAEIMRVNQETGRSVILPKRTDLAAIIKKEFPDKMRTCKKCGKVSQILSGDSKGEQPVGLCMECF